MGKEKRKAGKGFGKVLIPPNLDKSFDFEELAKGSSILVACVIGQDGVAIADFSICLTYDELISKFEYLKAVTDIVFHPSQIYLARRRQLEHGKGLLTLTPKSYRQACGLADESDGEIIFNWWTLPELKKSQPRSYIFGGSRIISELSKPLINYSDDRFPVICHAVPFKADDQEISYAHLLFTVSFDPSQVVKQREICLLERETQTLIELFIPNAENATVDIRKLRDYCLNQNHDEGKHKSRLFLTILGMTAREAEYLQLRLLEVVKTNEAKLGRRDQFGQRYTLDFILEWKNRRANIRSGWIIEEGSNIPRLTTCYPL
ncbi:hypothetical protein Syn7502_00554 [Synechococcus sp. PCC 7502]|uniref:DUF6883 domain-containing protein n=1 Tax=Synechococcus sp. PCC 7502 TaxID=1173263 RepID=UPI00029FF162|nr:DUF6883 domain-containing protein [Synechococcus sp. PCC 7502]AFY72709.1 hypothetical protein Syn7502_00554 [Synechococcus sp. PCC 7502]